VSKLALLWQKLASGRFPNRRIGGSRLIGFWRADNGIAARITETTSRVRIAFAAACPEADLFRNIAHGLQPVGP
jgi:hypothetical protein